MKQTLRVVPLLLGVLLCLGLLAPTASAEPTPKTGTVEVTIVTGEGVPATVTLKARGGRTYTTGKTAAGSRGTTRMTVAAGPYQVAAGPITVDGAYYTALRTLPVRVRPGRSAKVTVVYRRQSAVRDFRARSVGSTRVELAWTAESIDEAVVRRTTGEVPASTRFRGTAVPVYGRKATDSGLEPGTEYSYALFVRRNRTWIGPLALRVGTVSTDPTEATYVANPQTAILEADEIAGAVPTGAGVRLDLSPGRPTPGLGAAVVLPISAELPGGFLGKVVALSPDGRTVALVAASMDDAFDYWELNRSTISVDNTPSEPSAAERRESGPVSPKERKPLGQEKVEPAAVGPSLLKCPKVTLPGQDITISPSLEFEGHFNGKIDKYNNIGPDIPKGASFDMGFALTIAAAATIKTTGSISCSVAPTLPPLQIATAPVPISAVLSPSVSLSINGAMEVSNLGLAATAGVEIKGRFGLDSGANFSATPIINATPLTPSVTTSGTVGFKAGGDLTVGPGATTTGAGVIAGIKGSLYPIDASFGAVFPQDDPRFNACLRAKAAFTRSLGLTAKAWLKGWSVSETITLDALKGSTDYPGSPWYFPTGCKDVVEPGDSVLGDGVTKIEDEVTGGDNQWGYVPGFVPGKKTWVLSTGDINQAVGDPSTFASTQLGGPGDDDLTALSGNPTYDAVAYTVKLVPTGSTLHVRYAFASEEYPEYVGSQFNDVMGVYVNGQNCATVPGTTTPVSVNTINAGTNPSFFVDNATGASGYGTTMDGLTVPLECAVPVAIGQPVTVKITVADASDRIYDTAVALLDGGIWSD